ncbi:MAG: DNA polymerase I [Planctomycetaceae bacterium]|nr:DNA polymerase I [Planctomycetaceae bacterium]
MSDPAPAGSLYLLDAHGMIFQMFFGVGSMNAPDGRPTNAVFGVTRSLMNLYERGADYLIATLDHKEPTFREKIDADYKAHRDPPPVDLIAQEPMIQQVMEAMGIPFLVMPGYEADDIMATVSVEAESRGLDVFLCTSDKDCRQLVTNKVKMLNLRKDYEVLDAAGVLADWGVRPDQVVDFQSLVGDSVDNIPGVAGVGPKTAAKWIQELGSLDAIIANPDKVSGGPKTKQALKDAIANGKLAMSRQLVALDRNVPLTFDWEGWKRRDWDGQKLLELFHEFGFRGFAERVRKTLTASGASKNAAALEVAGLASPAPSPIASVSPPSAGKRKSSRAAKAPTGPSLFDTLMGETPAEAATTALTDNWNFEGYKLVDTPEALEAFLTELKAQKQFVFDLETTGLDPVRCEIVGYAFCWEATKAHYLPVRAPKEDAQLDPAATLAALKPVFENPAVGKRNHNIKFDQIVLSANGVKLSGVVGDSMIAHYLLHPGAFTHGLDDLTSELLGHANIKISELIGKGKKQLTMDKVRTVSVGKYACEDADTAFQLAAKLEPELVSAGFRDLYEKLELPLIRVLAEMEEIGIRVDVPYLRKLGEEMAAEIDGIEKEIHSLAGHPFNIASLKELQKVLFDELKLPIQKRTGIKNEPSTDQESLERLAALGHALPKRLVAYRQVSKLKNTYVDVLPAIADPNTHRVHTSFNQAAAETGRLSSSDPNLQNIPTRTEQGAQLRKAFIPRKGWALVAADYSQIELRLLAHFSGDETLRAAFAANRDVHTAVAAQIFKVPEEEVAKSQRGVAKTVNFGVLYGMSAKGLSERLLIPRKEAEEFIDAYFARYPKVLDYQQRLLANANKTGVVSTILGRQRKFARETISPNSQYRSRAHVDREAINMEIQGSAADLLKKAMLAVSDQLKAQKLQAKMLLTVHDELVFEAPPNEVETLAALARAEMTGAMKLDVPLNVDVSAGPNWLDLSDV